MAAENKESYKKEFKENLTHWRSLPGIDDAVIRGESVELDPEEYYEFQEIRLINDFSKMLHNLVTNHLDQNDLEECFNKRLERFWLEI